MTQKSDELERIALVDGHSLRGVWAVLNMIGGISGLSALLLGFLVGGQYIEQLKSNTRDIAEIKAQGSPSLKVLERTIATEVDFRRVQDESINKRVEDVRADFSQRITNITGLLERLVEQQTRLISLIQAQQQIKSP
jgi:hypothetical protein